MEKYRANIGILRGASQAQVESQAQKVIGGWLEGKEIKKVIFVSDRLINFVVH